MWACTDDDGVADGSGGSSGSSGSSGSGGASQRLARADTAQVPRVIKPKAAARDKAGEQRRQRQRGYGRRGRLCGCWRRQRGRQRFG